jgi:hypothetical protein
MRPCTELNPCEPLTKYAVVFDEQPMPDSFTSCSGRSDRPQHASTIAAVTESWPHPAHKVDMLPSYWRRVSPSSLVGSEGWATFGLLMNDMAGFLLLATLDRGEPRRLGKLCANLIDDGLCATSAIRCSSISKTAWISPPRSPASAGISAAHRDSARPRKWWRAISRTLRPRCRRGTP